MINITNFSYFLTLYCICLLELDGINFRRTLLSLFNVISSGCGLIILRIKYVLIKESFFFSN